MTWIASSNKKNKKCLLIIYMLLYAKIKEQSILRNCIKTSQKIDILFEELLKKYYAYYFYI